MPQQKADGDGAEGAEKDPGLTLAFGTEGFTADTLLTQLFQGVMLRGKAGGSTPNLQNATPQAAAKASLGKVEKLLLTLEG